MGSLEEGAEQAKDREPEMMTKEKSKVAKMVGDARVETEEVWQKPRVQPGRCPTAGSREGQAMVEISSTKPWGRRMDTEPRGRKSRLQTESTRPKMTPQSLEAATEP